MNPFYLLGPVPGTVQGAVCRHMRHQNSGKWGYNLRANCHTFHGEGLGGSRKTCHRTYAVAVWDVCQSLWVLQAMQTGGTKWGSEGQLHECQSRFVEGRPKWGLHSPPHWSEGSWPPEDSKPDSNLTPGFAIRAAEPGEQRPGWACPKQSLKHKQLSSPAPKGLGCSRQERARDETSTTGPLRFKKKKKLPNGWMVRSLIKTDSHGEKQVGGWREKSTRNVHSHISHPHPHFLQTRGVTAFPDTVSHLMLKTTLWSTHYTCSRCSDEENE